MPVNYQLGKIYKIVDNTNDNIYIGSTCEPTLARRLASHMTCYNQNRYSTSCEILKNGNYDIVLLENCPCNSKDELFKRERHHIESIDCVNKNIPGRTQKEYELANKEKIQEYKKIYNTTHKAQIRKSQYKYYDKNKAKYFQPINCCCGSTIKYNNRADHMRTLKHANYKTQILQLLKQGRKQIKLAVALIDDVQNIKPLKIKKL